MEQSATKKFPHYPYSHITPNFHLIRLCCVRLRHAGGADTFDFSLCVNPHQVRCAASLLHPSSSSREWSCDYRRNSSASWRQLTTVLRCGGLKPQPVGIAGRRSKTGLELQNWELDSFSSISHSCGCRLARSVARAPHVPRLCSRPGFDSWPGSLCCVALPLSYPVSCHTLQLVLSIKARKGNKNKIKFTQLSEVQQLYLVCIATNPSVVLNFSCLKVAQVSSTESRLFLCLHL